MDYVFRITVLLKLFLVIIVRVYSCIFLFFFVVFVFGLLSEINILINQLIHLFTAFVTVV